MAEVELPLDPVFARQRLEGMGGKVMFEKVLTSSDTSGSGRIVIPKSVAESHFPVIDNQNGINLGLLDTFGKRHVFRFRYWINNASRMYLVEGTQELLKRYKLAVGDVLMFAKDSSAAVLVAGRKGTKDDVMRKPPVKRIRAPDGSAVFPPGSRAAERQAVKEAKEKEKLKAGEGASKEAGPGRDPRPAAAAGKDAKAVGSKSVSPKAGEASTSGAPNSKRAKGRQEVPKVENASSYWNGHSLPARLDGVFRTMPPSNPHDTPKVLSQYGYWTAMVSLAGEMYQAFFDSRDAAEAAFAAAKQGAA